MYATRRLGATATAVTTTTTPPASPLLAPNGDSNFQSWPYINGLSFVPDAATAPDGTMTGTRITESGQGAGYTYLRQDLPAPSNNMCFAVFVQPGQGPSGNDFAIYNFTTNKGVVNAHLDYTTGLLNGNIQDWCTAKWFADNWCRVTLWPRSGITAGDDIGVYPGYPGLAGGTGVGNYCYMWGAKVMDMTNAPNQGLSTPVKWALGLGVGYGLYRAMR